MTDHQLLSTAEMGRADRAAISQGISGLTLMERAGGAVAREVAELAPSGAAVAVLCGPGNNGGDGFVAARLLQQQGYRVRLGLLGEPQALRGDAAAMAARWSGAIEPLSPTAIDGAAVVVDALFGAGLKRPLEGTAADVVAAISRSGVPVLAVDLPSGVDGDSGEVLGSAVQATRTITFFRRKPGHLLFPGRTLCGEMRVADIGIPNAVLDAISPRTFANGPDLWLSCFPHPRADQHKYTRGHAVVLSGPAESTGAARLGALAALRVGAGLVTVVGSAPATAVNATHLTAVMVKAIAAENGLADFLADRRRNAVLLGPGAGVSSTTTQAVLSALATPAAVVLDADALTSFGNGEKEAAAQPGGMGFMRQSAVPMPGSQGFFDAIRQREAPVVLTPHEGESKRLFGDLPGSKLDRARSAAARSGAFVVLKGPDSVIAAPDGRAAINENAPAWLATAGSGDVLAGLVTGLLAQGMPAWEAAAAAVWLHGRSGDLFGPGLIAEDLPDLLPRALQELLRSR